MAVEITKLNSLFKNNVKISFETLRGETYINKYNIKQ